MTEQRFSVKQLSHQQIRSTQVSRAGTLATSIRNLNARAFFYLYCIHDRYKVPNKYLYLTFLLEYAQPSTYHQYLR